MYGLRRSPIRAALQKTDVKLDRASVKVRSYNHKQCKIPILVLVHDGREDTMCVRAGADEEEDDQ
jgi:hypothetical protein